MKVSNSVKDDGIYTYVLLIMVYNLKLCQILVRGVKYADFMIPPGAFWVELRNLRIGLRGWGKSQGLTGGRIVLDLRGDCWIRIDHLNVNLLCVGFSTIWFLDILQTILFSCGIFRLFFEIHGVCVIIDRIGVIEVLRVVLAQMDATVESLADLVFHF